MKFANLAVLHILGRLVIPSDLSAQYFHNLSEIAQDPIAQSEFGKKQKYLNQHERTLVDAAVISTLKTSRYVSFSDALSFSKPEVES